MEDLNETDIVESRPQSNYITSSLGTYHEKNSNKSIELCKRSNSDLLSQTQKVTLTDVSSGASSDSVLLSEDSDMFAVDSLVTESKQLQMEKDGHLVSEISSHLQTANKERNLNNQKRDEKQITSGNNRGKKSQVAEQQKINLEQLQYIHKLEARVKELEQTLSLLNRKAKLNSDNVPRLENTSHSGGQHCDRSNAPEREAVYWDRARLQVESLEMKVKQLEINMFQNLYLMTMNSSQVNVQFQTHAFMMQNCQMQQMYALSSLQAGRFHPPVYNCNPFMHTYSTNFIPSMTQFSQGPNYWHPMSQVQFQHVIPPPPAAGSCVPPPNISPPPVFNASVPPPNVPLFPAVANMGSQFESNSGSMYGRQRPGGNTGVSLEKHLDSPVRHQQHQSNIVTHNRRKDRLVGREDCLIQSSVKQLSSQSVISSEAREECLNPPNGKQLSVIFILVLR